MATAPDAAILQSLDGLLVALQPQEIDTGRFRFVNEPSRFPNLFGGQLVAQAQRAMDTTVEELGAQLDRTCTSSAEVRPTNRSTWWSNVCVTGAPCRRAG